jgi:hypothetical protein
VKGEAEGHRSSGKGKSHRAMGKWEGLRAMECSDPQKPEGTEPAPRDPAGRSSPPVALHSSDVQSCKRACVRVCVRVHVRVPVCRSLSTCHPLYSSHRH